jgi:hypothetical protein
MPEYQLLLQEEAVTHNLRLWRWKDAADAIDTAILLDILLSTRKGADVDNLAIVVHLLAVKLFNYTGIGYIAGANNFSGGGEQHSLREVSVLVPFRIEHERVADVIDS